MGQGQSVRLQLDDAIVVSGVVEAIDDDRYMISQADGKTVVVRAEDIVQLAFDPDAAKVYQDELARDEAPLPRLTHQQFQQLAGRETILDLESAVMKILTTPQLLASVAELSQEPGLKTLIQDVGAMQQFYKGQIADFSRHPEVVKLRENAKLQSLLDALEAPSSPVAEE